MRNRLKELMQSKGVTQQALANKLGVSRPTISYWTRMESLTVDTATAICGALGVSLSDLIGAEGEGTEKIIPVQTELPPPDGYIRIHVYDVNGSCGGGCQNSGDLVRGAVDLAAWFARSLPGVTTLNGLQIVSSSGDSMTPTIESRALVLVDTNQTALKGDGIYCLRVGDDLFIKRIMRNLDGTLTMISDNPAYPPSTVDRADLPDTAIIGRVVFAFNGKTL